MIIFESNRVLVVVLALESKGLQGADHLTLEGGGEGWLIFGHQEFFFSSNLVGRIFFPFFPIGFLLHLCCMQFFPYDKSLHEIFFKITHPPPPSRVKWSFPNDLKHSVFSLFSKERKKETPPFSDCMQVTVS